MVSRGVGILSGSESSANGVPVSSHRLTEAHAEVSGSPTCTP
ncbi:MAG: hypothetical protein ACXAC2_13970 [Candidatus Kariarchaeaceae archaeon]